MNTNFKEHCAPRLERLPTLLTVKQACDELQIGRTQLYGLCQAGSIRAVKIGTRGIRIPREEIARFVRERLEA